MSLFTIDQGNTNSTIVEWINETPHRVNEVSSLNAPILVSNVKGKSFQVFYRYKKNSAFI